MYDFDQQFWQGTIPLQKAHIKEHFFGIEFDSFTSAIDLQGKSLVFHNVDAMANNIHFQGEIGIDRNVADSIQLTIKTHAVEGKAKNAISFLNHFERFKGIDLPLQGNIISGDGDIYFHGDIGKIKKVIACKIALDFQEGSYPFSQTFGFENLSGTLYYSTDNNRFLMEKVKGTLMLTAKKPAKSYHFSANRLELDREQRTLIYDCGIDAPTHEVCRFVGHGIKDKDELTFTFDPNHTRLYGTSINIKTLTFKQRQLSRTQLDATLSAIDLLHCLDFLNASGILLLQGKTLDPMLSPNAQGNLDLNLDYDLSKKTFSFHVHSNYLSLGSLQLDHLTFQGRRSGDYFTMQCFEMGALSMVADMKKEDSNWDISNLEVIWRKSFLQGSGGSFNTKDYILTLPIEKLCLEIEEIKHLFPHATVDHNELCGTLYARGAIVFDFSKGLQQWCFDASIQPIGKECGRAKLCFESIKPLQLSYHPCAGFCLGKGTFNLTHPLSNQYFAQFDFDGLTYTKKSLQGEGVKIIVSPEMLSLLAQTNFLPRIGYKTNQLTLFDYPIQWENQIEVAFDYFSLGENTEITGFLKEGYYWIGDKSWYINHFFFHFDNKKLRLNIHTAYQETPFAVYAHFSFFDQFRSRFEIKELIVEEENEPPLIITTEWNDNEGFFIQTLEGKLCGLDFSFYHNPKDSFLDRMALAGQLKINVPKATKLFPERMQRRMQELDIGKGYELSGDLIISKQSLKESRFSGYLKGKNFQLMGSVMKTLLSEIDIRSNYVELHHFNLSDTAGIFSIDTIEIHQENNREWVLNIPEIIIQDFRPSLLKKMGQYPTKIKPLTIRNLHCHHIHGILGKRKSFTGEGRLYFINTFKRDYHILDIPFEILGRLGLDMGLLIPVRGELDFVLIDGRIYLTDLKKSYSEGKRSQFSLSSMVDSYLDFEGNLNIHVKMKQYVLLKVTEPFILYIGGTFGNPKYTLK